MPVPQNHEHSSVAVVGAGTLGRRIATMFANRGGHVYLIDTVSPETLDSAAEYIDATLPQHVQDFARRNNDPAIAVGTVTYSNELETAIKDSWLVIESVPEQIDIKREVLRRISAIAAPDTIIATNSSSFASSELADSVDHPSQLLNLHFYQPPEHNHLDMMSCGYTDPAIIEFLADVLPKHDIQPHLAKKESTGFIFNRIWAAIKRESLAVVGEGVAEPQDVDAMFKNWFHAEKAPFEMMDNVGLDIVLAIEEHYAEVLPWTPEATQKVLQEHIAEGNLGRKTGKGFYDHGS